MSSLLIIFRGKLIPWAEYDLMQRLIVARPGMKCIIPDTARCVRLADEVAEKLRSASVTFCASNQQKRQRRQRDSGKCEFADR